MNYSRQHELTNIAKIVLEHQNFTILCHRNPDGDTLGAAFGLCFALRQLGRRANVLCSDPIPPRYEAIYQDYEPQQMEEDYVIAVDIADTQLLGEKLASYADKIELCLDHHVSNTGYAHISFVDPASAAVCEFMCFFVEALGASMTQKIADALYTGLATDTGCFKFANVTPQTHRVAAALLEAGAHHWQINRRMFDIKSRGRLMVERYALDNLEFYCEGRIALLYLPWELVQRSGADDGELDGISGLTRQAEGVLCGITIRQQPSGALRVSTRSSEPFDCSRVCQALGGGGHPRAAGCTLSGPLEQAKAKILAQAEEELKGCAR